MKKSLEIVTEHSLEIIIEQVGLDSLEIVTEHSLEIIIEQLRLEGSLTRGRRIGVFEASADI